MKRKGNNEQEKINKKNWNKRTNEKVRKHKNKNM